jgi:hypothetical protein
LDLHAALLTSVPSTIGHRRLFPAEHGLSLGARHGERQHDAVIQRGPMKLRIVGAGNVGCAPAEVRN